MKNIKSVMLIDDSKIDLFITQTVIENLNLTKRIHTFSNATDALNYLELIEDTKVYHRLFAPQIILLDINMPIMDGFDFLIEFDKFQIFKQKPIAIFMLSSSLNPNDYNKANNNKNVLGVISKPLTADKLIELLNKIPIS